MDPVASVVIPAHDEEAVLGRCLRALLTGASPGEFDVIVVANGCHDGTAEVARAAGVRTVETEIAGKVEAIAAGDPLCRAFPRIYLDADVELTPNAVRLMVATVRESGALAGAPEPSYDLAGVSGPARRFHRVHDHLLTGRRGLAGTGAYLLTEAGHERAFPLPKVISDDGWVHRSFTGGERVVVIGARTVVRPARTLRAVVRRRARVRLGNRELDRLGRNEPVARVGGGELAALLRARRIGWLDAGVFAGVLVVERLIAGWRKLRGADTRWSADRTSRSGRQ